MDATMEEWSRLVAVNMTGVWLGTKVCASALAESGKSSRHGSAIVNLASIAGIVGSQLDPLYSMTKGGVTLFTKSTALAFGRKGWKIRVNSILPGWIVTEMTEKAVGNDKFANAVMPRIPARRWGEIDDFGGIAVYLASDASAYATGADFLIDGGYTKF